MKSLTFDPTKRVIAPRRLVKITPVTGTPVLRLCESQLPITPSGDGGNTWTPIGSLLTLAAIKFTSDGSVPSTEIEAVLKSGGKFDPTEVDNGKWKNALVQVYPVDRDVPVLGAAYFTGRIGRTTYGAPQSVRFEVRGQTAKAKGNMMQHFGPMCRTDLGSILCKIPIWPIAGTHYTTIARGTAYPLGHFLRVNTTGGTTPAAFAERVFVVTTAGTTHATTQPSYNTAIDALTTDGTVVVKAVNSFTRWGQVTAIGGDGHEITINRDPDARAVDRWFNEGLIYFRSGILLGQAEVIANWDAAAKKLTTWMNFNGQLVVGDYIEFNRGCDKRKVTCNTVFANSKNRRNEDDFFGSDVAIAG